MKIALVGLGSMGRHHYNVINSIESVELIVLPQIVFIDTVSICNLDSIFLEGAYQNTSGFYYDTLSSSNGCDSLIVTSGSTPITFVRLLRKLKT